MTLEALHIAGACFTSAVLAVVLVLWIVAEQRRAAAEAREHAVRLKMIAYHVEELRLVGIAADQFDKAVADLPVHPYLDPLFISAQRGYSAVRVIQRTSQGALDALRGEQHG